MKKFIPLIALIALVCITFMSCLHHDNDISITYNDEDEHYSMKASFSKRKVKAVERYMDRMLGDVTDMSFVNTRINGKIALDDHTIFFIKKYPGYIKIRLNKYENTEEAYERIRAMCEGMKDVLIDKEVVVRVE
jgi:hypothetical protein